MPGADTNRLLLLKCFWSALSTHNLGMDFIYKGIAVLESKFPFEIKDWDFLTAGSLIYRNDYWILTHCESQRQRLSRAKHEHNTMLKVPFISSKLHVGLFCRNLSRSLLLDTFSVNLGRTIAKLIWKSKLAESAAIVLFFYYKKIRRVLNKTRTVPFIRSYLI